MKNNQYTQSVIKFDGENNYIDFDKNNISGVFSQGNSAFTMSGWVNPLKITNQATS
ncbi:MAG: hypothetical protein AAF316_09830 [Cyanobacteria bacterium P01_A01_bin.80]